VAARDDEDGGELGVGELGALAEQAEHADHARERSGRGKWDDNCRTSEDLDTVRL